MLRFLLCVLPAVVIAAWRDGHNGIDRPGHTYLTTQMCSEPGCCFELCQTDVKCLSWSYKLGSCEMKDSVPKQTTVTDVSSGVKQAAEGEFQHINTRKELYSCILSFKPFVSHDPDQYKLVTALSFLCFVSLHSFCSKSARQILLILLHCRRPGTSEVLHLPTRRRQTGGVAPKTAPTHCQRASRSPRALLGGITPRLPSS